MTEIRAPYVVERKTNMTLIRICKAQPIGDPTPDIYLIADQEIPSFESIGEQDEFCARQAQALEIVLLTSLPGATYDQLLLAMLQRKATHFRVSHSS